MAFVLSPAPRIFTKQLRVVLAFLRRDGLRLVIFLDDILLLNISEEGVRTDLVKRLDPLQTLGFIINWEKSLIVPTHVIEYYGMVIDSVKMSFALPVSRFGR